MFIYILINFIVMDIAEKLYMQGYISYPRTETDKFPPTLNLREHIEKQMSS
jgi:DNA topoisomerase-3